MNLIIEFIHNESKTNIILYKDKYMLDDVTYNYEDKGYNGWKECFDAKFNEFLEDKHTIRRFNSKYINKELLSDLSRQPKLKYIDTDPMRKVDSIDVFVYKTRLYDNILVYINREHSNIQRVQNSLDFKELLNNISNDNDKNITEVYIDNSTLISQII